MKYRVLVEVRFEAEDDNHARDDADVILIDATTAVHGQDSCYRLEEMPAGEKPRYVASKVVE